MEFGERPVKFDGESSGYGGELASATALELTVALYSKGALPMGKAVELAGLTRREFWECLKEREISMPSDETEIGHELRA